MTVYIIFSSDGNTNTYIPNLNDEYTGISQSGEKLFEGIDFIVTFEQNSREVPVMFKYNKKYYMITSGCTEWSPIPASYAISDKVLGNG